MSATVIIPTLWLRSRLLKRCITSIAKSDFAPISLYLGHGESGYASTTNRMLSEVNTDFALLGNDDQEYYPDCISNAVNAMMKHFPDTDGMVGIRQEHGGTVYAICLLGRKFMERFPRKAVMCPDYISYFQDQELYEYAKSIDKFHFCKEAVAIHYLPKDKTRKAMYRTAGRDEKMWKQRQRLGLLWGRDFNLMNSQ